MATGNVIAFDLCERTDFAGGRASWSRRPDFRRQVINADAIRLHERDGPVQRILQLANAPGPRVRQQQVRGVGCERWHFFPKSLGYSSQQLA
jgi:hypothetical protein